MSRPDQIKQRQPLEIDLLLTEDERRPLSVAGHQEFRERLAGHAREYDEIDELVEAIRAVEFEEKGAKP